jgi:hypothetical protein
VLNANNNIDTYLIRLKGLADCEDTEMFQTALLKYATASGEGPANQTVTYDTAGPIIDG